MKKIGKKGKAQLKAYPELKQEYINNGVTICEICGHDNYLSYHHDIREGNERIHTFEMTRLVCTVRFRGLHGSCHDEVQYNEVLNEMLMNKARGFDPDFYDEYIEKLRSL